MKVYFLSTWLVLALRYSLAQESDLAIVSDPPSLMPSDAPSDAPSMVPSDAPSILPSDVPSMLPSDVPSMMPSDLPSSMPSDLPSSVPAEWSEEITQASLEEYEICGLVEHKDLDALSKIGIFYLYKLTLDGTVPLDVANDAVEAIIREAVLDSTCVPPTVTGGEAEPGRVHAISSGGDDVVAGSCGVNCFVILGSVNLLVNTEGLDEYREIYCDTMQTVRDLIVEGTLSEATGVESTAMFSDTPGVSNIDCPELTAPGAQTSESALESNKEKENFSKKGLIYGAAACGVVLFGIFASRKRYHVDQSSDGVWISNSSSSASRYNLSVITTSQDSPWHEPSSMEAA